MPLLFSYGSLLHESVQLATFGRRLEGREDELPRFERTVAVNGRTHHANVTFSGSDEGRVCGAVFEISAAELAVADGYEKNASYKRIEVVLSSGKQAWVYVHSRAEDS